MTLNILSLIANLMIVGLLMATISYCWVLNKRIKMFQDGKSELANLLKYFDESTSRASETIVALQSASKKIGETIQVRIDKANYLMDDLAFMMEKGNRLADQLEANLAVNRARSRVIAETNTENEMEIESKVESSGTVKQVKLSEEDFVPPKTEKISTKEKTTASLEAVLDRVISRNKQGNSGNTNSVNNAVKPKAGNIPRSKTEQELLEMIRAGAKG